MAQVRMSSGTALRPIDKLFGKAYAAGETIPPDVVARMTPQVVRSLVNKGDISVEGMTADTGSGGMSQHLMARIDKLDDTSKKQAKLIEAQAKEMEAMRAQLAALAAGTGEPKADKKSRRAARAADGSKE